jgi:hypothetical protein
LNFLKSKKFSSIELLIPKKQYEDQDKFADKINITTSLNKSPEDRDNYSLFNI